MFVPNMQNTQFKDMQFKEKIINIVTDALQSLATTKENTIITNLRREALLLLNDFCLFNPKEEAWRYSPLQNFDLSKYTPVINPAITTDAQKEKEIINFLTSALNEYKQDNTMQNQENGLKNNTSFLKLLNLALFTDLLFLTIPQAQTNKPAKPIFINHIIDTNNNIAMHRKNILFIEPNANTTIVEQYIHDDASTLSSNFINSNTEIVIGDGAILTYYLIQTSDNFGINVINTKITQNKNSNLTFIALAKGNSLNHADVTINLSGNNTTTNSYIYNYAEQKTIHNLNLTVNNNGKNCNSQTTYRAVINDKAKASFTGNIIVKANATQTDAKLQCNSLLLSKFCEANTLPVLEINCDDVKCSHGATIGYLDLDAIFYLRSRGISINDAKNMLVESFITPVINKINIESIKKLFDNNLNNNLGNSLNSNFGNNCDNSATINYEQTSENNFAGTNHAISN